jgi:hypothetical protein
VRDPVPWTVDWAVVGCIPTETLETNGYVEAESCVYTVRDLGVEYAIFRLEEYISRVKCAPGAQAIIGRPTSRYRIYILSVFVSYQLLSSGLLCSKATNIAPGLVFQIKTPFVPLDIEHQRVLHYKELYRTSCRVLTLS